MGELIANLESYSIYKAYNDKAGDYYLCVPNNNIVSCQIFLGFNDMELDNLSNDEIISMINDINSMIMNINNNSMYVIPNISLSILKQATLENDDRMYLDILNNKIQPITSDVYNMLIKNGINTKKINQVIQIIEKSDHDKKLGGWLSMKLGDNYINELDYQKLKEASMNKDNQNTSYSIPITDEPVDNIDNTMINNDNQSIAPINREYENVDSIDKTKSNQLVRKLTKQSDTSKGFSNIKFIVLVLLLSLVVGISIGYIIMK